MQKKTITERITELARDLRKILPDGDEKQNSLIALHDVLMFARMSVKK